VLDRMTKLISLYLALSAQVVLIVYTRSNRLTVAITGARKQKFDHTYRIVTQDHESPDCRVNIIVARLTKYHPWHQPL
jgi:hypothetical protein